jgi:dienelactone hydrolase
MNRICLLGVCLSAGVAYGQTTYTATYQSYNPSTGAANLQQSIVYVLPDANKFGPGPYPVFIHVPGTFEVYNASLSMLFVNQMAARGFLSASVQYMNTESKQSCAQYTPRAQSIFDTTQPTSAASVLCSLSKASCHTGITANGISQGAELSLLAANYSPYVKAVFAISGGDAFVDIKNFPLKCVDKVNTKLPANRLTIVNGISDPFFGGQTPIQNVSGFTCAPGATQCWSPDGSGAGWYIVQNWQNATGLANHCYIFDNKGTSDYSCSGPYDPNWNAPATYDWSLGSNLDWLATLGTHRNFSSTGY